jgi:hypothetical protein
VQDKSQNSKHKFQKIPMTKFSIIESLELGAYLIFSAWDLAPFISLRSPRPRLGAPTFGCGKIQALLH